MPCNHNAPDTITEDGITLLVDECPHCGRPHYGANLPGLVKAYQDHLREHHHKIWVRQ